MCHIPDVCICHVQDEPLNLQKTRSPASSPSSMVCRCHCLSVCLCMCLSLCLCVCLCLGVCLPVRATAVVCTHSLCCLGTTVPLTRTLVSCLTSLKTRAVVCVSFALDNSTQLHSFTFYPHDTVDELSFLAQV